MLLVMKKVELAEKYHAHDAPAAFRKAVNFLALTTALTPPLASSITTVLAGSPPALTASGASGCGTHTIFVAVPNGGTRAGINRAVWWAVGSERRGGWWIEDDADAEEKLENTRAESVRRAAEVSVPIALSTSVEERTRRDMVGGWRPF